MTGGASDGQNLPNGEQDKSFVQEDGTIGLSQPPSVSAVMEKPNR